MELSAADAGVFFETVMPHLGERQRRVVTGALAEALGRGGQTFVAGASGISTSTMSKAVREVRAGAEPWDRQRAEGGGDRPAVVKQPGLLEALDELVHPVTRGSPMSPLRWTLKSTRQLARELAGQGFKASAELVRRLLHQMGYSLQAPAKQNEGAQHPDRDAQFAYLNRLASQRLAAGDPVISVDTKKKELIGPYANGGAERQPAGEPERVSVHDFADRALGEFAKAIPYGVYDVANNAGWVSVGDSADTAEFAVESIRRWWNTLGRDRFPTATRLLITADAGGSNGYRPRAWKWFLAQLAAGDRPRDHHLALPARHQQMEQDRTPPLQLHHHELARPTPHRHRHDHRAHRLHHHPNRTHRPSRLRPRLVPTRHQDHQHTNGTTAPAPPQLARRNGTTPSHPTEHAT